jgi:small conductance mechanosensitive channel
MIEAINWQLLLAMGLRILLILVIAWVVLRVGQLGMNRMQARLALERDPESGRRAATLVGLLRQGVSLFVWLMVGLILLREVGVDIAPVLASAGVVGLAVGFGAQNLVRDIIAGFFIILEDQIRVGDVAVLNGTGGVVEAIRFRTTILRDINGTVHVFPNGTITTIANMARGWGGAVFDIGVAYKEDVDQVMTLMKQVGQELRVDAELGPQIIEDLEVMGVEDFADSAVVIRARFKTRPLSQWNVAREYRRRLKRAFDDVGIEMPFPQRSVLLDETRPLAVQILDARSNNPQTGADRQMVQGS